MEEREIDLMDLIVHILSHWRGILACMLAGALLLGAFSYVRSYPKTDPTQDGTGLQNDNAASEAQLQMLEQELTDTEKVAVYTVIADEQKYASYQQYVESSAIMQMDPYNIYKIVLLYIIQIDDIGQNYMLRSVYEDLVNGVGLLQWVEDQTGISSVSAAELISAQGKSNITVVNGLQEADLGRDYLKVTIVHYDETECERLAQCVKEYMEQQYEYLSQELGAHEVVLLSESAGVVMDTGIRDRQLSYSNNQITLLTNCAKAKDAFTENQQVYYELLKGGEATSKEDEKSDEGTEMAVAKPSVSVKYVVVGAVLFAFVYAGVFLVLYVLNGKLRTADELQRLYNISQLGLIVKNGEKKKFFIDSWIDALRNWNKRRFTREQSLELAAAAIKISMAKQELDTICLMGCDLKAGADVVCQELERRLEQENIAVKILDNVLYDASMMEELESAKGIVLVEKAGSTMYNEILRELELVSRQGIKVLGGIVVE